MTRKTIAHYLADLRVDLKDSGTLWSDAELTRCIERAVADYSRLVPRELSAEITVDSEVTNESFTTPQTSDTDYFVTSLDISASTDGATATLAARKPDVPRPVIVTVTDANTSISQLIIIVKGHDVDNNYIEEFFYLEGGLVQTGERYFSLVTGVEIDEIAGNGAADTLIVGTGAANGVYVQLANKPIKLATDVIASRTRNTDYIMDYAGGRIAMKAGGNMVANTAYTISYTKSKVSINLSTIIDELFKVDRVEWPAGNVPQQFAKFEVRENILTITGDFESQKDTSDEEHVIIFYLAPHSAPSSHGSGSFPNTVDTVIQLAASAYALLIKAVQYEHQAATDLTSSGTTLSNIAAVHTSIGTALAKVATHAGVEADAALDKVVTHVTEADTALDAAAVQFTAAATALAKVTTYLENNTNEDSKFWLTKITTDIANLRTATQTALAAAKAYLDETDTTDFGKATVGAEAYTEAGDNFIDAVNVGANVPALYAEYSRSRVAIADSRINAAAGYIQEASLRVANLRTYIEQASGWGQVAAGFANEAGQRIAAGEGYVNEANMRLGAAQAYVQEATQRVEMASAFIREAEQRNIEADKYLAESNQYQSKADADMALSDRFRTEAIERRNEAWAIWGSPRQIAPVSNSGQRGQQK